MIGSRDVTTWSKVDTADRSLEWMHTNLDMAVLTDVNVRLGLVRVSSYGQMSAK